MLQAVKEIFAEQPGRPKLIVDHAPAAPVAVVPPQSDAQTPPRILAGAMAVEPGDSPQAATQAPDGNAIALAAASFIEAGLS
jgi:hypothetical protein